MLSLLSQFQSKLYNRKYFAPLKGTKEQDESHATIRKLMKLPSDHIGGQLLKSPLALVKYCEQIN